MRYKIKRKDKVTGEETVDAQEFTRERAALDECERLRDGPLGVTYDFWAIEEMEGPFIMDGDTIIPNPKKGVDMSKTKPGEYPEHIKSLSNEELNRRVEGYQRGEYEEEELEIETRWQRFLRWLMHILIRG